MGSYKNRHAFGNVNMPARKNPQQLCDGDQQGRDVRKNTLVSLPIISEKM
jgi:hypothetical protein